MLTIILMIASFCAGLYWPKLKGYVLKLLEKVPGK